MTACATTFMCSHNISSNSAMASFTRPKYFIRLLMSCLTAFEFLNGRVDGQGQKAGWGQGPEVRAHQRTCMDCYNWKLDSLTCCSPGTKFCKLWCNCITSQCPMQGLVWYALPQTD